MISFNPGWYLLYTKPSQEKKVAQQLSQMSITRFLPAVTVVKQWHDRKKSTSMLLFPSYVFLYLDCLPDFFQALELKGVCNYVRVDKKPVIVPQQVIDQVALIVRNGEDVVASSEYFTPGQSIIVRHGPLEGLSGEIVQYAGRKKILVRITLLNRSILVNLSPSFLQQLDGVR